VTRSDRRTRFGLAAPVLAFVLGGGAHADDGATQALPGGQAFGPTAASDSGEAPAAPSPSARPPLGHDAANYTFAVGAFAPDYEVPRAGSYELPPIDSVADHPLVDARGLATSLRQALGGRLAVVSFIYATCGEATGCPMSTAVLRTLDRKLASIPSLAGSVALVTISFDPERDTPARLVEMEKLRSPGSTWQFFTTSGQEALAPLLDDFGQQVSRLRYADGTWTGVFRHVLKVYLLDGEQRVRNVYSVGFLNPELVLADLETLRMGAGRKP
jgi:cytochrome c peroxidase